MLYFHAYLTILQLNAGSDPPRAVETPQGRSGDTLTNMASAKAVLSANRIQVVLDNVLDTLACLSDGGLEPASVQASLGQAEDSLTYVRKKIGLISRPAATEYVDQPKKSLDTLEQAIFHWRDIYPNTAAVKIDNSKPTYTFVEI